MSEPTILLLDTDPRPVPLLAHRLGAKVVACRTVEDALSRARDGDISMAIGEAAFAGDFDGLDALGELQARGIPSILWTSRNIDELVGPARQAGIGVLSAKTTPLLLDELALAWTLHTKGWEPGLSKFLGPASESLGTEGAVALDQISQLCRRIQSGLEGVLGSSRRLRLVLDEMLSNAIHHSPLGTATVSWGRDATKHVFSVRDQSGALHPGETLRLLDRHIRGEGLLDSRGRGLHLSRIYADRLYVNVVPGRITEVAAVFWNQSGAHQGFKPVWMLRTNLAREA
ncbi:MAG TPA: ATP-binding protein [Fibrobacteria bacterium]|nr:ATP-binding protein [Fibrobacteria bacterium]